MTSSLEVESMKMSVGPVEMSGILLLLALLTPDRSGAGGPQELKSPSPSRTRYLARSAAVGVVRDE